MAIMCALKLTIIMYQWWLIVYTSTVVYSDFVKNNFTKCQVNEDTSVSIHMKLVNTHKTDTMIRCARTCTTEDFCQGFSFTFYAKDCSLYSYTVATNEVPNTTDLYIWLSENPCAPGWFYIEVTQSCYYISSHKLVWNDAKEYCWYTKGGYLSDIIDQTEQDAMVALVKATVNSDVWLGGHYLSTEFHWTGNIDEEPRSVVYTQWAPQEPYDNFGGIMMWKKYNFQWNDGNTDLLLYCLCKKPRMNTW